MKQFKAEHGAVHVNSGQVKLSAEQARARAHCLTAIKVSTDGAGVYQVKQPIQFKRGETFGFDGQIGKNGILNDPDAEKLEQMEGDEARIAAGIASATAKIRKDFADQLAKAKAEFEQKTADAVAAAEAGAQEALIAKLSEDLAGLVRAELAETAPETAG